MIWVAGNLFYKTTKESVARSSQCIHIYHKNTRNTCTVNAMHIIIPLYNAGTKTKNMVPIRPSTSKFSMEAHFNYKYIMYIRLYL